MCGVWEGMHLARVLTMAVQCLGYKPPVFPLRSRVLPFALRFPAHYISSAAPRYHHCHRRFYSRNCSSVASGLKTIRSCSNCKVLLWSGASSFRAVAFDWRLISPSVSAAVIPQRAYAEQMIPGAAAGAASQSRHLNIEKTEEQQEMSSIGEKMVAVRNTVELTQMEERIFGILTATLKHFNLKTQLRVAGGWVRDKLIGRNSVDIDIALDDMMGRVFCEKVNAYLQTIGEKTHSVGLIQSNPDQSKHLETANMQVLDMRIDFVNLRAETYTETSRIPEMKFGSPEQDAYRRDLTINSLFYNINTKMVEDFTNQGIADLKAGIIRTPLPPDTTFLDDPLRVCRAIRFGARFDFTLDEELKKAAASKAVRTALENKVSRERIGHEIELMLMGNQPGKAMQYVEDLSLHSAVFWVPKEAEPDPPILENHGRLCVDALQTVIQVLGKFKYGSQINIEQLRLLLFGAFFLPFHRCTCFADKRKKKKIAMSTYLICESLKLKNKDASGVETLHATALRFQPIIKQLLHVDSVNPADVKDSLDRENAKAAALVKDRVELGLLLMSSKELWRGALLLASVIDLPAMTSLRGADVIDFSSDYQSWVKEKVEMCNAVEDIVLKLGLTNIWESKPLLGGKEIMAALDLGQGMHVQDWKDRVLRWQLAHPQSTAEECHDWLLEENVKRLKTE